jgi:hypothetical protein
VLSIREFGGIKKKLTMSDVDKGFMGQAWNIYMAGFVHWFFWNSESYKYFLSNKEIFIDFRRRIAIFIKEAIIKTMLSKRRKAMKSKDGNKKADENKWTSLNQ